MVQSKSLESTFHRKKHVHRFMPGSRCRWANRNWRRTRRGRWGDCDLHSCATASERGITLRRKSVSKIAQTLLRRNRTVFEGAHPQCGDSGARWIGDITEGGTPSTLSPHPPTGSMDGPAHTCSDCAKICIHHGLAGLEPGNDECPRPPHCLSLPGLCGIWLCPPLGTSHSSGSPSARNPGRWIWPRGYPSV